MNGGPLLLRCAVSKSLLERNEKIRELKNGGASTRELAKMFGLSRSSISLIVFPVKPKSLEERFWANVNRRGESECWEWRGYRNPSGYGRMNVGGRAGRLEMTHRLSWEIHNGPIPGDLRVLHHCDNPPCVNPAHLWLGTQLDNIRDRTEKGHHNFLVGEKNPHAKLTWEKVGEIRRLYATGEYTQDRLAREYGVAQTGISRIVLGKSWQSDAD
jgi:DNA-binding XRE family transcriptional regulator